MTTTTLLFSLAFIALFSRLAMAGMAVGLFFLTQNALAQSLGFDPLQGFFDLFGNNSGQVAQGVGVIKDLLGQGASGLLTLFQSLH